LEAQAALVEASTSQATDFPTAQEDDDGEEAVELGTETEDDEDVRMQFLSSRLF
jgi:hypothetical protein